MSETPGQRSASTVLDLIDGTLDDHTSPDAMRWSPEPPATVFFTPVDVEAFRRAMAELGRALDRWLAEIAPAIRELGRVAEGEPDIETEPTDPMQRALWLRRHRSTGPVERQRAPKRIDPRRTR